MRVRVCRIDLATLDAFAAHAGLWHAGHVGLPRLASARLVRLIEDRTRIKRGALPGKI